MKKSILLALLSVVGSTLYGKALPHYYFPGDSTVEVELTTIGTVAFVGSGSVTGSLTNLINKVKNQADTIIKRVEQTGQKQTVLFTKKEDRGKSHGSTQIKVDKNFNLNFQTATGAVSLTDVEGKIKGRVENGSVTVTRGKGKIAVSTDQGDVTVTESEAVGFVMTRTGNVTLQDIHGPLKGITQNGKVTYKTTNTYFTGRKAERLQVNYEEADIDVALAPEGGDFLVSKGNITARNVYKSIVMTTDEGNLTVNPASTGVRARTRKGKVSVTVAANSTSTEPINIENHDGDVELIVPNTFAGNFIISLSQNKNLSGSYRVTGFMDLGNTTPHDIIDPKTKILSGRETQINQKVRNGTRPVRIRVVNGNVFIKRS